MKQFITGIALVTAMAVGFVAHAGDGKSPTTAPTTQASAEPINKFCPLEPEHAADKDVTWDWNGKTVAFCCEGCIGQFQKDPEKYAKNMK